MNKIIKKFVIFVLPFLFLFINVSYAAIETGIIYTGNFDYTGDYVKKIGSYSISTLYSNVQKYLGGDEDDLISNMNDLINNQIISKWYVVLNSSNSPMLIVFPYGIDGEVFYCETADNHIFVCFPEPTTSCYYWKLTNSTTCTKTYLKNSNKYCYGFKNYITVFSPKFSVKSLNKVTEPVSGYQWDGTSYYYKDPSDETDSPTLPTNSQIAQAVQNFYNTDYYKNNKDFNDFIVMYNVNTKYFDFIGHTLGDSLGQVIIPPNYRYQGKLYNDQWWKFYIDENQGATAYGTSYYLCSTNNFGQHFINEGVGKISELVGLDFSTKSVIVYSTTDYPVRTYVLNEETGDYTYTDGVIEGDQYTYDENLDPTISGYNPLDNFVTVDPSQSIINDADFEGFANSFEEHKDLFSFTENMQWLFAANNKLSNYFLGFIVMCALFITLSRVLKG